VIAVAVLVAAALALPAVPSSKATSGTLIIATDTTLTEDHNGNIEVSAQNITLDCDGHSVIGDGTGIGILTTHSGVTVKNCHVNGFSRGIGLGSSDTSILNNEMSNSGRGFQGFTSSGGTVEGNLAFDNLEMDFATFQTTNSSFISNIARSENSTLAAFGIGDQSNDNLFKDNSALGRGEFWFGDSHNNTVTGNLADGVNNNGFSLANGSSGNLLTGNTAAGSDGSGFTIREGSSGNTLTNNEAHRNGGFGILDLVGINNVFSGNVCTGNADGGSDPSGLCQEEWIGLVDTSSGMWHLRHSENDVTSFLYGNPGDLPILGDWDGDGTATPGLYRQSDGFFYSRNSNTTGIADAECFAGDPSDVPIAGDWDGDGDDNLGIYRPSEQMFYLFTSTCTGAPMGAAQISFLFGNPGDKPVAGDWDGDGIDEVGLHRESTGFFYWRDTLDTGVADGEIFFGDPGDRFVSGDWGVVDGMDTPGLFRPSDVTFYFRHTLTQGVADSQFTWTGAGSSWLPVAGDFGLG
jgi:parallel beta-helix repeat protein